MSIRKLKNGKWIADVTVGIKYDGTPDRRTKTCATKTEAQRAERKLLVKKDAKLVSGRITIDEFIANIYWPAKSGLRGNTKRGYESDIKLRIIPSLSGMYLEDIGHSSIQKMIDSAPTRKAATNARETLSSILGLAANMEMIARNPASLRYTYPQKRTVSRDRYGVVLSTFDKHHDFFDLLDSHDHYAMLERIVVLGLCFGLRKGEIFGLDWENVDLDNRMIRITQTYVTETGRAVLESPKTPNAVRDIPMSTHALERMRRWDLDRDRTGPIVRTKYGTRMNPGTGQDIVRRFTKKYDDVPNITIHSMRHSFATACINAGIDVARVSLMLGHRNIATTYNRYVRPMVDDIVDDFAIIDAAFG